MVVKEALWVLFFPCYINKNQCRRLSRFGTYIAHHQLQACSFPSGSFQCSFKHTGSQASPSLLSSHALCFLQGKSTHQMVNVATAAFASFPCVGVSATATFSLLSTFRKSASTEMVSTVTWQCLPALVTEMSSFTMSRDGEHSIMAMSSCTDDGDVQFYKLLPLHYVALPLSLTVAHFYSVNKFCQ